jgi:hypothetical protein
MGWQAVGVAKTAVVPVYLEEGNSRVFACSLDWPGWCRRAKTDEEALDALIDYAPRYAPVAERAGLRFPGFSTGAFEFDVVERIPARGGATFSAVDFGALGDAAAADRAALSAAQAKRLAALVESSWAVLDDVVAGAPARLRKGPRGGGRDRDAVFAHVVAAETSYARKLGVRHKVPAPGDLSALHELRSEIAGVLRAARESSPGPGGWLPRYAARRIAWHVLDHAWEIEDKSA